MNISELLHKLRHTRPNDLALYHYKGKVFSITLVFSSEGRLCKTGTLTSALYAPLIISASYLRDMMVFGRYNFDITSFYILKSRRDIKGVYA